MPYSPRHAVVNELVIYFSENPTFKAAFDHSFQLAYASGLEAFKTFDIHSVEGYLKYMDEFLYWIPTEDVSGKNVYNHICMFYFILDLPPVRDYQNPVDPAARSPWRWLSQWLTEYAQEMGMWMSSPESIHDAALKTFVDSPAYRDTPETKFYQQYPPPPDGWKTFNEFFARAIEPTFRPIADAADVTAIVSPADCIFDGVWPVSEDSSKVTTFGVKDVPWSIGQLLDDETTGLDCGPLFAGGTFTHSFLRTTDYHRVHSPVSGVVVHANVIPGLCHLEVVLDAADGSPGSSPRLRMRRAMLTEAPEGPAAASKDAGLVPGYQFMQARALVLIDSEIGLVAVLSIGMAQMSSVIPMVRGGDRIEKGQEISRFQFGGSDVVMVFQKGANVKLDQEKGTRYKFGSRIGTGEIVRK